MNIRIMVFCLFFVLTNYIGTVQIGVNNQSAKKVTVEFGFLVESPDTLGKIITDSIIVQPGKFTSWKNEVEVEKLDGSKSYLTFCTVNGKQTCFDREFMGRAWYLDVYQVKTGTYGDLRKYLDCYDMEKRSAGNLLGLLNLKKLLAQRTYPDLIHSPNRFTRLFLKLPE